MTFDPRRAAYALVAAGISLDLPVPHYVQIGRDDDVSRATLLIQLDDDDRAGVDRWAAFLNLPHPALSLHPIHSGDRWWQPYEASAKHSDTGRTVWVKSHVTVSAPADEKAATR
ncbi:hypothetical protein [Micromonospora sp. NPDC049033]|uniref:hypothetical protein n=1 Tax=Micromonospora sp. NPDC049033 TaxID=3155149 RepID=UPI0033D9F002